MEVTSLLAPSKLWTRAEVLARPCPVPASAGVYAWFFDWCPQEISPEGLARSLGLVLLYVGIAPAPPRASRSSSRQTLRSRWFHRGGGWLWLWSSIRHHRPQERKENCWNGRIHAGLRDFVPNIEAECPNEDLSVAVRHLLSALRYCTARDRLRAPPG